MPRIAYTEQRFRQATLDVIDKADRICTEYAAQGYSLTLRQVYYQFVARGWLPNSDKSYKRLGNTINDARLAGLMDWNHIIDRNRFLRSLDYWDSPAQIIEASAEQFRRNLWVETGQQYRPEVWVEKDALIDVVARAANALSVPHLSCRGYMSQSEMWAAGRRMRLAFQRGLTPVVIHLGDHDPSGLDMTRDIQERLSLFAERPVEVRRIALNMDQVEQYSPPPNPAKVTDSRAEGYIAEFGHESWELDALEPSVLDRLIRDELAPYIDSEAWDEGEREDAQTRGEMTRTAYRWDDLVQNWPDVEALLDGEDR